MFCLKHSPTVLMLLLCYILKLTIWSGDVEVGNVNYPHQKKPWEQKRVYISIKQLNDFAVLN